MASSAQLPAGFTPGGGAQSMEEMEARKQQVRRWCWW